MHDLICFGMFSGQIMELWGGLVYCRLDELHNFHFKLLTVHSLSHRNLGSNAIQTIQANDFETRAHEVHVCGHQSRIEVIEALTVGSKDRNARVVRGHMMDDGHHP